MISLMKSCIKKSFHHDLHEILCIIFKAAVASITHTNQ